VAAAHWIILGEYIDSVVVDVNMGFYDNSKPQIPTCKFWGENVHCSITLRKQVCTFHDGCKQGIDQQIFNRKSISRKITLLFATYKRYAAFFSMFLQLPMHRKTASLSLKKNITELSHNSLQAIKYKKSTFLSPDYSYFSKDLIY